MKGIKQVIPIDFQWPVQEPFLFCVHHLDHYPEGNENLGVDKKHFSGRTIGSDFLPRDGFRLYHGKEIPGFPVHPHRGFETITIVRQGYVDHADSLGAAGRYGEGDVQWMTAGGGVQHSEMFPLLHRDKGNTVELFQLWLNLPKQKKLVPAEFKMLWSEQIPKITDAGCEVSLICGEYAGRTFYQAPENSWASDPDNKVSVLLVKLERGGTFTFPPGRNTHRTLYFFQGEKISVNGEVFGRRQALILDPQVPLTVLGESEDVELLLLEGKPIGESIFQHGPFVMNSRQEVLEAIQDYQRTEFGGWDWERPDMIHGPKLEKFARYPDGRIERP